MNQKPLPTVAVVGASRGLGRGAAEGFATTGARVIAVARTEADLLDLQHSHPTVVPIVKDATDPSVGQVVIDAYQPDVVVLSAGATPYLAPFDDQTWKEFSTTWETDVKLTHSWLSAALGAPLQPGSTVIVVSSGAALSGSHLTGGYAGANAMQRFMAIYANAEAKRRGLDIAVTAVLPRITPLTQIGASAARAYAARDGSTEEEFRAQLGEPLTPAACGSALLEIARTPHHEIADSYLLTSGGLQPLS